MRKEVAILCVLFVISVFAFSGVYVSEAEQVDKAYTCLENTVLNHTGVGGSKGCASLSVEDKIFSLLSIGECKNELLTDVRSGSCWPKLKGQSSCDLETTAKAVL